jgi:hypothetical protein
VVQRDGPVLRKTAFLQAGSFARTLAHIVKLRAADLRVAQDFHLFNARAVQRKVRSTPIHDWQRGGR